MNKKERALELFRGDYNCSQSVFGAFSQSCGVSESNALSIGSGFGGGIGRRQKTCGVVTGAVMALGCRYFDDSQPQLSKKRVGLKTKTFLQAFEDLHGSLSCLNLLGFDFTSEDGRKKVKELNLFEVKCEKLVADACDLLAKMMAET